MDMKVWSELREHHESINYYDDVIIAVDKVGGGTPFRMYDGDWDVSIYTDKGVRLEKFQIRTGIPHSHVWVADMAWDNVCPE